MALELNVNGTPVHIDVDPATPLLWVLRDSLHLCGTKYGCGIAQCHFDPPIDGTHMPPGAPGWHLPHPRMPLVSEGRTPAQLARQLADRAQNGNKTPAQLLEHVAHDRLVAWGWSPGEGRAPVPVPHAEFVAAMKAWIDGGCAVPE